MKSIYANGLVYWDEAEILLREQIKETLVRGVRDILQATNPAWKFVQVETPILTPPELVSEEYRDNGFNIGELYLRPETTAGSYEVAKSLQVRPPLCVWQYGKSFRNEQDKTLSHMRLKEFYQLEFQCVYSADSKNDYQANVIDDLAKLIGWTLAKEARVVESDRLPAYSERTIDIEVNGMEIASISKRKDYAEGFRVLEIAIGLDRCVYQRGVR